MIMVYVTSTFMQIHSFTLVILGYTSLKVDNPYPSYMGMFVDYKRNYGVCFRTRVDL